MIAIVIERRTLDNFLTLRQKGGCSLMLLFRPTHRLNLAMAKTSFAMATIDNYRQNIIVTVHCNHNYNGKNIKQYLCH